MRTAQGRATRVRCRSTPWSAAVTVAVVDTGVDGAQPYLSGHMLSGIDVVNGGAADTDCVGHGTLVAGLIAGQPRAGVGFTGIAPGATILPVRQADNETDGTAANLAAAINAAVAAHAQVINVSIVTVQSGSALSDAVSNALSHGVIVVAAAGNDQEKGNAPEYPASYPGVISVGSIGCAGRPSTGRVAGVA